MQISEILKYKQPNIFLILNHMRGDFVRVINLSTPEFSEEEIKIAKIMSERRAVERV